MNLATKALQINLLTGSLALVLLGCLSLHPNFDKTSGAFGGDFIQEYIGAHLLAHGDRARFYDFEQAREALHDVILTGIERDPDSSYPMIYPPFYYRALRPLLMLSYTKAVWLWFFLGIGCLLLTLWLWTLDFPLLRKYPGPLLLASTLFYPLVENAVIGHKATLILLILTATWHLLKNKKPFYAGLVFGFLAFKPPLTLVIAFAMLFKREWAFIRGGAVTGVLLIALCFWIGSDVSRQYWELSLRLGRYVETDGFPITRMHCLYGAIEMACHDFFSLRTIQIMTLITALPIIVLLGSLLRGPLQASSNLFDLQFSGLLVATILLSPHLLTYDLSLMSGVFVVLVIRKIEAKEQGWSLGQLIALAFFASVGLSEDLASACRIQLSVVLLLALFFSLYREAEQVRESSQDLGG